MSTHGVATHLVGDGAEGGEVELSRIGAPAGDEHVARTVSRAFSRTMSRSMRNDFGSTP
jgi:hypothetical protein